MLRRNGIKMVFVYMIAIIVCTTMLLGSTFAWFTDANASNGNIIKSGSLEVQAYWMNGNGDPSEETSWNKFDDGAIFDCEKWEPGFTLSRHVKIENDGNLAFSYKLVIVPEGEVSELADVIDVYYVSSATQLTRQEISAMQPVCTFRELLGESGFTNGTLLPKGSSAINEWETVGQTDFTIVLKMKEDASSDYQNLSIGTGFSVMVLATQYSYESDGFDNTYDKVEEEITWDGTADISWYNETDTEFELETAEQLAGLSEIVDSGDNFEGKKITLTSDVNLLSLDENGDPKTFNPIGDVVAFKGEFDGNGHSIENLYQSGWDLGYEWGAYGSIGLFGAVDGATIKNVTVSGAETYVEGGDVGGITGSAKGDCVFENITIEDSAIATYNNGVGGIIGWSGAGNYTFKDVIIASDVVLGGLWGSFDSSIGGVVGQGEPGATYNFENVKIECRLDVYNDVTAAYQYYNYRMSGMIIGRLAETVSIEGVNYPDVSKYNITCNNVNVVYGEWADYHYCKAENSNGKRVEAGYQYGGIAEDYDHTVCTVHHEECIPFDQLFGGDQYGVKGLKEFSGVTVVYNNDKA